MVGVGFIPGAKCPWLTTVTPPGSSSRIALATCRVIAENRSMRHHALSGLSLSWKALMVS